MKKMRIKTKIGCGLYFKDMDEDIFHIWRNPAGDYLLYYFPKQKPAILLWKSGSLFLALCEMKEKAPLSSWELQKG